MRQLGKQARRFVMGLAGVGLLTFGGLATAGDQGHKGERKARSGDARVEARLDGDIQKDARLADKVDAQVSKGKVTLTGSVDTEADKVRAEQLARTSGGKVVDNQLKVSEAAAPAAAEEPGQVRALSDPQRKDPLVGSMPAEQTGSRELRLRTMGMEDPKLQKQREQARQNQKQNEQAPPVK